MQENCSIFARKIEIESKRMVKLKNLFLQKDLQQLIN
jgi:hypothetical protein